MSVERNPQDGCMFSVYCPRHRSKVLLFADSICELVNRSDGVELHWRCSCGEAGLTRFDHGRRRVV